MPTEPEDPWEGCFILAAIGIPALFGAFLIVIAVIYG